jgi:tetratricopeptide (TPR) repeat protein
MAEAWLTIGQLHLNLGDPACEGDFERAVDCAQRSGNHSAELDASGWLVFSFTLVPIRIDVAIGRAEQLLDALSSDPWAEARIRAPLSNLYAYVGRFAEARATITRAQAIALRSGARLDWALDDGLVGDLDMLAGEPAAAEVKLRQGCETLRAIGERGYLASFLSQLAEAVYAQGRLAEADQLTREAETLAAADDLDAQHRWRVTRAKVLARRGQFTAARKLASEAEALLAPTPFAIPQAAVLEMMAEVARLAGEPEEAAGYLHTALHIYEEQRASALADRTRAALASLSANLR